MSALSPSIAHAVSWLSALALVTAFAALSMRSLHMILRAYAAQSLLLGAAALLVGLGAGRWHIVVLAVATLAVKGWAIPWFLFRTIEDVRIRREADPFVGYPLSLLGAVILALLSYAVVQPLAGSDVEAGRGLAMSITLMQLGLWLMVGRKKAITQVVGLLIVDNGLFVAALSTTFGMPMIIELGLLFDLLVAVLVMSLLIFRIQTTFASISTEHLSRLKG